MARIATKKNVDNRLGNYFEIKRKDIEEAVDFGRFEVVVCKGGVIFRTYTGFMLWCTPWVVAFEGKAGETSLYQWLVNLVAMKKECVGKESEPYPYMGDASITYQDVLDSMVTLTAANLTHPTVAFIDMDEATRFAQHHIDWLISKSKELESAMNKSVPDETKEVLRKNFEHEQGVLLAEEASNILDNVVKSDELQ